MLGEESCLACGPAEAGRGAQPGPRPRTLGPASGLMPQVLPPQEGGKEERGSSSGQKTLEKCRGEAETLGWRWPGRPGFRTDTGGQPSRGKAESCALGYMCRFHRPQNTFLLGAGSGQTGHGASRQSESSLNRVLCPPCPWGSTRGLFSHRKEHSVVFCGQIPQKTSGPKLRGCGQCPLGRGLDFEDGSWLTRPPRRWVNEGAGGHQGTGAPRPCRDRSAKPDPGRPHVGRHQSPA